MIGMRLIKNIWSWINTYPLVTDSIITLVLIGLSMYNLMMGWEFTQPVPLVVAVILTLALLVPLVCRRRFPLIVLIAITVVMAVYRNLDIPEGTFTAYAFLFAFFSAGAYGSRRWRNWIRSFSIVATIVSLVYLIFYVNDTWSFPRATLFPQLFAIFFNLFLFGAAWWIGDIFRIRRDREMQLEERTKQLEIEREENARRAVLDERVRISRELHDVVAHHVSVMGVQAGAARRVLEKQPQKAQEALELIEQSSRQAVNELYRLLGFLRHEQQEDTLKPQPSLLALPDLVSSMNQAGLPVTITIKGKECVLPPGVDLSAYRIIQEALTNTLKHAGPARAMVTIRYNKGSLELEIIDDGRNFIPEKQREGKGRGLVGMRERVILLGGVFEAKKIEGAGFSVKAKLPLG